MKQLIKWKLCILMSGLVTILSCEKQWHSGVNEYIARAARVFGAEPVKSQWVINEELRYPSRRILREQTPAASIGMIDFLRISDCDLQRLVGERNSGLGKVMSDSQLIVYTLKFIKLAEQCLAMQRVPKDLVEPLSQLKLEREKAIGSYIWNGTFASREFASFFSLSSDANVSVESDLPATLEQALNAIIEIAETTFSYDRDFENLEISFENSLRLIASSKYAGTLALQQYLLANNLEKTERSLKSAWATAPFCQRGANGKLLFPSDKKVALKNVFAEFYIPVVQRKASNMLRQSTKLELMLTQLIEPLNVSNSSFQDYWENVWGLNGLSRANLVSAINGHTKFWQDVFRECDMSPK